MCEYCENGDTEVMRGNSYSILGEEFDTGVYIDESTFDLVVEFGNEQIFRKQIVYCPICGRKLNK